MAKPSPGRPSWGVSVTHPTAPIQSPDPAFPSTSHDMAELYHLHELPPDCPDLAGGKALSLADMLRAGLPVPPGFCVTTVAMRRLAGRPPADDQALVTILLAAYRVLG